MATQTIKPAIIRLVSDCDKREKFRRYFPDMLNTYYLDKNGQIIKEERPNKKAEFFLMFVTPGIIDCVLH